MLLVRAFIFIAVIAMLIYRIFTVDIPRNEIHFTEIKAEPSKFVKKHIKKYATWVKSRHQKLKTQYATN